MYYSATLFLFCFKRKIGTHLDLLSIPPSAGKMSKRLGGIIGYKDKNLSWHLNGFPDDRNIGSTVQYRGETHRFAVYLH